MFSMKSSNLGYPRIGENREWKRALELYWSGDISENELLHEMEKIRLAHLRRQKEKGIELIPVGDFTLYDHMLDTAIMFDMIPKRFQYLGKKVPLDTYFSMARGNQSAVACEMTKWFNTNYHYIVPEYDGRPLSVTENKPLLAYQEAKERLGIEGKPVLIGPYTFVKLSKGLESEQIPIFIEQLVPLYVQVLQELEEAGVKWVQIDEPILVTSIGEEEMDVVTSIYEQIHESVPHLQIMLQTYFDSVTWYEKVVALPVQGIGLDWVHGYKRNGEQVRNHGFPKDKVLGVGLVDGRNIWRSDLFAKREQLDWILQQVDQVWVQPSCSLLHVPVTVNNETQLKPMIKQALAFADERLEEIQALVRFYHDEKDQAVETFTQAKEALHQLAHSAERNLTERVQAISGIQESEFQRDLPYSIRSTKQASLFQLPSLPTTTIGSFPQTDEVRKARRQWKEGNWSTERYHQFIQRQIEQWISWQEEIGLDVLVHGEFERTDMVEFFGEKLGGFAFTQNAWVQSYGSRCVRPPIIYGDVVFLQPMTVQESVYAQSLTKRPVKGMITGPVTILNWSFVREDLSRQEVAYQIALALRSEVESLESSGIRMIQVDEPALGEGLPLKQSDWNHYLDWAVNAFRLVTSSVQDTTQIHTHMCYCEFHRFIHAIIQLDADVISIETSRSHGELLSVFTEQAYHQGIGLGVYDIHSPRIPSVEEITGIIEKGIEVLDPSQFWVNPDCGLKTRDIEETMASLKNMVTATKRVRKAIQ